jgi:hypothetical protein
MRSRSTAMIEPHGMSAAIAVGSERRPAAIAGRACLLQCTGSFERSAAVCRSSEKDRRLWGARRPQHVDAASRGDDTRRHLASESRRPACIVDA